MKRVLLLLVLRGAWEEGFGGVFHVEDLPEFEWRQCPEVKLYVGSGLRTKEVLQNCGFRDDRWEVRGLTTPVSAGWSVGKF